MDESKWNKIKIPVAQIDRLLLPGGRQCEATVTDLIGKFA